MSQDLKTQRKKTEIAEIYMVATGVGVASIPTTIWTIIRGGCGSDKTTKPLGVL
jgi:hypothetical protein